jgi:mono/diheme cytochrome c family protein
LAKWFEGCQPGELCRNLDPDNLWERVVNQIVVNQSIGILGRNVRNVITLVLALIALCAPGTAQSGERPNRTTSRSDEALHARGKYIVEGLARCGQCHTPGDGVGMPDRSRWLQGAPLWLLSAEPVQDWPLQAPRIAGSLSATDADMVKLLTTGVWTTGTYLRPPMPQFRMNEQDAQAVVAYLKSVQAASR